MTLRRFGGGLDTEATMSLIHIRNVGVISPRLLFHNLDLTIHETDRIGLIAGNGAGKTTLLRCLARQTDPGIGEITQSSQSAYRFRGAGCSGEPARPDA